FRGVADAGEQVSRPGVAVQAGSLCQPLVHRGAYQRMDKADRAGVARLARAPWMLLQDFDVRELAGGLRGVGGRQAGQLCDVWQLGIVAQDGQRAAKSDSW